jgi:hypothetical protein
VVLAAVKSYFHRVYQRYKSQREGRTRIVHRITHDSNAMTISSLTIENETRQTVLRWRDVIRVDVFKRDLYVVDQICLALVDNETSEVEINEEMDGWLSLVQQLPEYLPGCQTFGEWYQPVAIPAFEQNLKVIYERGKET